jgi:transcriptional regulator with GAF, ATPase, and Fis domain
LQRERLREQGAGGLVDFEGLPLDEATARLERHLIMHALEQSNYVQSHAADRLGTTRRILKYKMDQLGMAEDGGDARSSMAS